MLYDELEATQCFAKRNFPEIQKSESEKVVDSNLDGKFKKNKKRNKHEKLIFEKLHVTCKI